MVKHNGPLVAPAGATPTACPGRWSRCWPSTTWSCTPWPGPRRRWPRSPTTSPITATTWTTGCAPGCSAWPISPRCRSPGRCSPGSPRNIRGWSETRLIHESVRRMIDLLVNDLLAETRRRLAEAGPQSAAEVRALAGPVVAFSPAMDAENRALKAFLYDRMYRHERVNRMTGARPPGGRRAVRRFARRAAPSARGVAARRRRAGRDGDGAAGRRLHRRHDRPLRPRSAPPAGPRLREERMNVFNDFRAEVLSVIEDLAGEGKLPAGLDTARVSVEPPRDAAHGDLSTNAAMVLAKPAGHEAARSRRAGRRAARRSIPT